MTFQNVIEGQIFCSAILPPGEMTAPLLKPFKYNALYIIRNHLHTDLKSEYVIEEEPNVLSATLQTCYE
jgi:hypothetical protein